MTALIITLLVLYVIYRICRAILKPIIDWLYEDLILHTLMNLGMSRRAAKATVAIIIILLIIVIL